MQHQIRANGKIRAREVLVITESGEKLGVMKLEDALARARQVGLDLIEVAAGARPPVCKIVDYGKYRYQQNKQERDSRKVTGAGKVKEIKIRPNIAEHDYMTKVRNAEAFLDKGMKCKLTLMFRGREMQHAQFGHKLVSRVCADLNHIASLENVPRQIGRSIIAMLAPLPASKRGPRKFSAAGEEVPESETEEDDHDDESDETETNHQPGEPS